MSAVAPTGVAIRVRTVALARTIMAEYGQD